MYFLAFLDCLKKGLHLIVEMITSFLKFKSWGMHWNPDFLPMTPCNQRQKEYHPIVHPFCYYDILDRQKCRYPPQNLTKSLNRRIPNDYFFRDFASKISTFVLLSVVGILRVIFVSNTFECMILNQLQQDGLRLVSIWWRHNLRKVYLRAQPRMSVTARSCSLNYVDHF